MSRLSKTYDIISKYWNDTNTCTHALPHTSTKETNQVDIRSYVTIIGFMVILNNRNFLVINMRTCVLASMGSICTKQQYFINQAFMDKVTLETSINKAWNNMSGRPPHNTRQTFWPLTQFLQGLVQFFFSLFCIYPPPLSPSFLLLNSRENQ